MKRLLALLLVICLLLCGCQTAAPTSTLPQETSLEELECRPLLYKLSSAAGSTLYLLGSIHAADKRAKPLPDFIMDAFEQSDYLAVECDIVAMEEDFALQTELVQKMLCEPGKKISDYMDAELYQKLVAFLQENQMYLPAYESYLPAMWLSLVENVVIKQSGLDTNKGIDMQLLRKAHKAEKEIREVEGLRFQYELLSGFDNRLVSLLIEEQIVHNDKTVANMKELYEAWLIGDADAILATSDEELESMDDELLSLYEAYNEAMITDRNRTMAEVAVQYLSEGNTGFMVVGAAHVIGADGIIDLLTQQGYTAEIVLPYDD